MEGKAISLSLLRHADLGWHKSIVYIPAIMTSGVRYSLTERIPVDPDP